MTESKTTILLRTAATLLLFSLVLLSGCLAPSPPPLPEPLPAVEVKPLEAVSWAEVDGWFEEDQIAAFTAFRQSCRSLKKRPDWQTACEEAAALDPGDPGAVRVFFETCFTPHRVRNPDGSDTGMVTGYYAPDLRGSRSRSKRFSYPLYQVPDDLLVIDLSSVYPELGSYRLRGRVEGRRVVPYYSRSELDGAALPVKGKELCWVEDPVELFFLHIQGSGRITLDDGSRIMVSFAEQNGHPYRSIGKLLLDRGAMTRDQMSMQNIRAWAQANPAQVRGLLDENPSYIFFHELAPGVETPPGALGIPLTAEASLAVDPRTVPLGAPVFLSTTWPSSSVPLRRLMVAQDTGGAIKGAVRADFFWGCGDEAGAYAGRMKQQGRMWVLLPQAKSALAAR
jgi:membrane-bound lytic murein transglycosylase A